MSVRERVRIATRLAKKKNNKKNFLMSEWVREKIWGG